jgi:hypothetical protein
MYVLHMCITEGKAALSSYGSNKFWFQFTVVVRSNRKHHNACCFIKITERKIHACRLCNTYGGGEGHVPKIVGQYEAKYRLGIGKCI